MRATSPQGLTIGNLYGMPQTGSQSVTLPVGAANAGGVQRMRSGGHSPGMPAPGTMIITSQQGSPRTGGGRATSPDGSQRLVVSGYPRAASPIHGGSLGGSVGA